MAHYHNFTKEVNNSYQFSYVKTEAADLAEKIHEVFTMSGYRQRYGDNLHCEYQRGNAYLRVLAGPFHNYQHYRIEVNDSSEGTEVRFRCLVTGMAGGFFGMNQVRKEKKRLLEALKTI